MGKELAAAGLTVLAVAVDRWRKTRTLAERYEDGDPSVSRVLLDPPQASWSEIAKAQKWALIANSGEWPRKSGTQGYLPIMSADDADRVVAFWRRVTQRWEIDRVLPDGPRYLNDEGEMHRTKEGDSINPWRELERLIYEVRALVARRTGGDPGSPADHASLAGEEPNWRWFADVDVDGGQMTFEETERFWYAVGSVATSVSAVLSYEPSAWSLVGEVFGDAVREWPSTFGEYTGRVGVWVGEVVGRAGVGVASGLASGLFGALSSPMSIVGFALLYYGWKVVR